MSETDRPRPRGHVEPTPEARPLPPAWRDHFQGPIPGMPPRPTPAPSAAGHAAPPTNQAAGPAPRQSGPSASPPPAAAPARETIADATSPAQPAAAPTPPEPHPAFQPEVNRPIPLYGDGRDRPGGERTQRSGWDAGDLLKPLAAGAALLAVAGARLAVRGVSRLADALANRRQS